MATRKPVRISSKVTTAPFLWQRSTTACRYPSGGAMMGLAMGWPTGVMMTPATAPGFSAKTRSRSAKSPYSNSLVSADTASGTPPWCSTHQSPQPW